MMMARAAHKVVLILEDPLVEKLVERAVEHGVGLIEFVEQKG